MRKRRFELRDKSEPSTRNERVKSMVRFKISKKIVKNRKMFQNKLFAFSSLVLAVLALSFTT